MPAPIGAPVNRLGFSRSGDQMHCNNMFPNASPAAVSRSVVVSADKPQCSSTCPLLPRFHVASFLVARNFHNWILDFFNFWWDGVWMNCLSFLLYFFLIIIVGGWISKDRFGLSESATTWRSSGGMYKSEAKSHDLGYVIYVVDFTLHEAFGGCGSYSDGGTDQKRLFSS